jgi:F-type H+-transporting ATPase subunit b
MEALGIDLKLLLAQIVNFIVLFLLLSKFLYKPITKILDERKEKIAQGIKDAEASATKLAEAETDAEKITEKAYKEANEILKSARDEANQEASAIVKKASTSAQKSMDTVAKEKSIFKEKALYEVKKEIENIVILALDKIVGEKMDEKQKDEVTAKVLKEL